MTQPDLFRDTGERVKSPPCAFGETGEGWTGVHHCPSCREAVERACEAFTAAVTRGEYDAAGWTPKERRAQRRVSSERTDR